MASTMQSNRRTFVIGAAGLVFARPVTAVAAVLTPRQTEGPFYPVNKPADQDIDLTRVAGRTGRAQGEVIELTGRVFKVDGTPLRDGIVEIWQTNAFGRYDHPRDRSGTRLDPNFQGFGAARTGADGAYRFRTVKPADYLLSGGSRRAPHIHFRVVDNAGRELTTQMYFPGEPLNASDWLYSRLGSDALREAATARKAGTGIYTWDIVVA